MGNTQTISYNLILRTAFGIVGFFLCLVPTILVEAYTARAESKKSKENTNTTSQTLERSIELQAARITSSRDSKVRTYNALDQFLANAVSVEKYSAKQLQYIKIARKNFTKQGEQLFLLYDEYLSVLAIDGEQQRSYQKRIYAKQKNLYNAFWEVHNLTSQSP